MLWHRVVLRRLLVLLVLWELRCFCLAPFSLIWIRYVVGWVGHVHQKAQFVTQKAEFGRAPPTVGVVGCVRWVFRVVGDGLVYVA